MYDHVIVRQMYDHLLCVFLIHLFIFNFMDVWHNSRFLLFITRLYVLLFLSLLLLRDEFYGIKCTLSVSFEETSPVTRPPNPFPSCEFLSFNMYVSWIHSLLNLSSPWLSFSDKDLPYVFRLKVSIYPTPVYPIPIFKFNIR